jgi:hypothetical protein
MAKIEMYGPNDGLDLEVKKVYGLPEYEIMYEKASATFDAGFSTRLSNRAQAKAVQHMIDHAFRLGQRHERRRVIATLGLET